MPGKQGRGGLSQRHGERSEAIHLTALRAERSNPSHRAKEKSMDCFVASAPRKKLGLGKAAATIKIVVARLDRAIQYAAGPRSISNASGILGSPGQAWR